MNGKMNIPIAAAVLALTCATEAASQSLAVSPATASISVGQTQQFTSPDVSPAMRIEAGDYHVCLVRQNGEVRCSGNNNSGQLGDGTRNDSSTPVAVALATPAVGVSAGGFHSCAALQNGTAMCWGRNDEGQLGDGTTTSSATPVQVNGITNAVAIAAGYHHSCALLQDGTVRCWGDNSYGELGDGALIDPNFPRGGASSIHSSFPVPVFGIHTAIAVTASDGYHSCAVLQDGTARCWGDNVSGQLGDGTRQRSSRPVSVSGLSNAATVSSGDFHTCALLQDGGIKCWGLNWSGQLGDGTQNDSNTPVAVSGVNTAIAVSVGVIHTCAVLQDGSAWCWGNNASGQMGDGTTQDRHGATAVNGVANAIAAVAAGNNDSCAVLVGGAVKCWGMNTYGELGIGSTTDVHQATPVLGISATWTSNDPAVATVDGTGLVTGVGAGVATITAESNGRFGSATVTVGSLPTLSVTLDGEGTITSSPTGIDCGANCTAPYQANTLVTLTATPASGASLISWFGCDTVSGTTCSVTMNHERTITSTFRKPTLTLTKPGTGRGYVLSSDGAIDCGPGVSACMTSYDAGASVSLAASASEGSRFDGWTGCDSTNGNFCALTMTASKPVTATFTVLRFVLTVDKPGVGSGTVTSTTGAIDCGSRCSAPFDYNTVVTLNATPALGSLFVGWSGCDAVSGASCTVAVRSAATVSANFVGVPVP
jgi:alpha-tubulin suppressor-like RCC1 family protein